MVNLIPRILFEINHRNRKRRIVQFKVMRRQYSLRLCYAMTINKSMGQTLKKVSIDLRVSVFMHRQLYVALGRVARREDALVLTDGNSKHKTNGKELLLNKVRKELII